MRNTLIKSLGILAVLTASLAAQAPAPAEALIRVCVLPAGDAGAADLRESAKDLSKIFADKRKDFVLTAEEQADVVVTVMDRAVTVPKVAIGVVSTGRMGSPTPGPIRELHLTVTLSSGGTDVEITNKNVARESAGGWKAAAADVAKQVEKWIAEHRKRSRLIAQP